MNYSNLCQGWCWRCGVGVGQNKEIAGRQGTLVHNCMELLFTSLLFLATERFFGLSTFSSESSALSDFLPGPYFTGLVQLSRIFLHWYLWFLRNINDDHQSRLNEIWWNFTVNKDNTVNQKTKMPKIDTLDERGDEMTSIYTLNTL